MDLVKFNRISEKPHWIKIDTNIFSETAKVFCYIHDIINDIIWNKSEVHRKYKQVFVNINKECNQDNSKPFVIDITEQFGTRDYIIMVLRMHQIHRKPWTKELLDILEAALPQQHKHHFIEDCRENASTQENAAILREYIRGQFYTMPVDNSSEYHIIDTMEMDKAYGDVTACINQAKIDPKCKKKRMKMDTLTRLGEAFSNINAHRNRGYIMIKTKRRFAQCLTALSIVKRYSDNDLPMCLPMLQVIDACVIPDHVDSFRSCLDIHVKTAEDTTTIIRFRESCEKK